MTVARSCSSSVLPVLQMTSYFHIMDRTGQNQRLLVCFVNVARWRHQSNITQCCLVEFAWWRYQGQICRLQLHVCFKRHLPGELWLTDLFHILFFFHTLCMSIISVYHHCQFTKEAGQTRKQASTSQCQSKMSTGEQSVRHLLDAKRQELLRRRNDSSSVADNSDEMPLPVVHQIWRSQDVTLTFDLQNLIRSSVGASKYSLCVSSRLLKLFLRYCGPDKHINRAWKHKAFADIVGW